jgi:potassium channel subfamily K
VLTVFGIYLVVGVLSFYAMEGDLAGTRTELSLLDALYMCIVTMTSVGYGDLTPGTAASRLFTCAYVFVGFGLMGWLLAAYTNFFVEEQHERLLRALSHSRRVRRIADRVDPKHRVSRIVRALDPDHRISRTFRSRLVIAGITFAALFAAGFVVLVAVEGLEPLPAFYCVCVTVTTLGYGDLSFRTAAGRAFAAVWIPLSTLNVAQIYVYIAEGYMESRRRAVMDWALARRLTASDLEAADLDGDKEVRYVKPCWDGFVVGYVRSLLRLNDVF